MLSLIIILIGLFTLTAINPVYSVIGLISLFGCSALYLINLSLYFIGLSYLIIYVGAIAILFLFVIMMINTKVLELNSVKTKYSILSDRTSLIWSPNLWIGSLAISPLLLIFITSYDVGIIFDSIVQFNNDLNLSSYSIINLSNWDNSFIHYEPTSLIGYNLYSDKAILLLLTTLTLLLAMIGPILLTL